MNDACNVILRGYESVASDSKLQASQAVFARFTNKAEGEYLVESYQSSHVRDCCKVSTKHAIVKYSGDAKNVEPQFLIPPLLDFSAEHIELQLSFQLR